MSARKMNRAAQLPPVTSSEPAQPGVRPPDGGRARAAGAGRAGVLSAQEQRARAVCARANVRRITARESAVKDGYLRRAGAGSRVDHTMRGGHTGWGKLRESLRREKQQREAKTTRHG